MFADHIELTSHEHYLALLADSRNAQRRVAEHLTAWNLSKACGEPDPSHFCRALEEMAVVTGYLDRLDEWA